jgi:hypothetical protein
LGAGFAAALVALAGALAAGFAGVLRGFTGAFFAFVTALGAAFDGALETGLRTTAFAVDLATGRFEPLDLVTGFFDGIGVSSITSRLRVTAPIITTNR